MTSDPTVNVRTILLPMAYQSSWLHTKGPSTLIEFAEFLRQSVIQHILTVLFHQSSNETVDGPKSRDNTGGAVSPAPPSFCSEASK